MSEESQVNSGDFGAGTFEDLVDFLDQLASSFAPDVKFNLEAEHDQKGVYLDFYFEDGNDIGMFLGRGLINLNIMQMWLRVQQIMPQDRYIFIKIHDPDESRPQEFIDKNIRKEFEYKVVREKKNRDLFDDDRLFISVPEDVNPDDLLAGSTLDDYNVIRNV